MTDAPDEVLYHVTYLANLPGIAADGLVASGGSNYSGGYEGHSKGRIFLTELDGVSHWYRRMIDLAEHHSENPLEDLLVPIVLGVDVRGLPLREDIIGTRDALAEAWFTTEPIEPQYLSLWDGSEWVDLEPDDIDPELAIELEEEWGDEDEEPWMNTTWLEPNPLRDVEPLELP